MMVPSFRKNLHGLSFVFLCCGVFRACASSSSPSAVYTLGNYKVQFTFEETNCGVNIVREDLNGLVVLSRTAPSCDDWFTFASGSRLVEQHGGTFQFLQNHIDEECSGLSDIKVHGPSVPESGEGASVLMEAVLGNASASSACRQGRPMSFQLTLTENLGLQFILDASSSTPGPEKPANMSKNDTQYTHPFEGVMMEFDTEPEESILGLGFQYTYLDVKGRKIPLFAQEQGVGRGAEPATFWLDIFGHGGGGNFATAYGRVPYFLTSKDRGMYLTGESFSYTTFDFSCNYSSVDPPSFGTVLEPVQARNECNFTQDNQKPNNVQGCQKGRIQILGTMLKGTLLSGTSPLHVVQQYTNYTGKMAVLPQWFSGRGVLGLQGGTKKVLESVETVTDFVRHHYKNISVCDVLGAVWLQDWTGQRNFSGHGQLPRVGLWWNWEVDNKHYPNWQDMVADLHSENIAVLTYINPLLKNVSDRGTPYLHNYYEEGLQKNYFIRVPCSSPASRKQSEEGCVWFGYGGSAMVDLTNPSAWHWYKHIIINNMLSSGGYHAVPVDGWMADFGESVPLNAWLFNSSVDPQYFHTIYPQLWAQLNAEAIKEVNRTGDVVFFTRSESSQSPQFSTLFWLGDQLVTWDGCDGLQTAITGMLSSAVSGFSLTHSDVGGYTSLYVPPVLNYRRSEELLMRWCELGAFTAAYRTHLGSQPHVNSQVLSSNATLNQWVKFSLVFRALYFYRLQLMQEAATQGIPLLRPMAVQFPLHEMVWEAAEQMKLQFMFGDTFLIAPVTAPAAIDVLVWFPKGYNWVHVWSDDSVTGNNQWQWIHAPLGEPAVFYACPIVGVSSTSETCNRGKRFVEELKKYGLR